MIVQMVQRRAPLISAMVQRDVLADDALPYTIDETSEKPVPATATEWDAFITYHGLTLSTPSYLHLCQEASGNLADSIGSLTLTANGTPAYQQSVTGWSRKALSGDQSTAAQRFQNNSGPNPSLTSVARFMWLKVGAFDVSARYLMAIGSTQDNGGVIGIVSSGKSCLRFRIGADIVTGTTDYAGLVIPVLLIQDITNSRSRLFTHAEKIEPAGDGFAAITSGTVYSIGATGGTWADADVLYECGWSGGGAEISNANAKAFFQALGYVISWS